MNELTATDRGYRRGLVLGLSLAELFIILVFLLLLATIGFLSVMEKIKKDQKAQIDELTTTLSRYEQVLLDNNVNLEEFDTLVRKAAQTDKLIQENTSQNELLTALQPIIDAIKADPEKSENEKQLIQDLAEALKAKDFDTASAMLKVLAEADSALVEELASISDIKQENSDLKKEKSELAELVEALGKERGDNPPCLYKPRPKDDLLYDKKPYKEIYSFDILIKRTQVIVVKRDLEKGNFGNFIEVQPQINKKNFYTELSFKEFNNVFAIYRQIGQDKLVQPYPCAFFAKVWWDKSMSSSEYERGIAQVNSIFFKDIMRSIPWPHDKK